MTSWFINPLSRKVFKNTAKLLSSKAAATFFDLITLICTTHALSARSFGVLTLIVSYVETIAAIGSFQSWQVVLHYAAIPWKEGQHSRVADVIKFALRLDMIAGFLSMSIAMIAVNIWGRRIGVRDEHRYLILIYCTLIPGLVGSTGAAILRLFDNVGRLARQKVVRSMVQAILCASALIFLEVKNIEDNNLEYFFIAWYIAIFISQIWMAVMSAKTLKDHHFTLKEVLPFPLGAKQQIDLPKGLWSFAWMSSINTLLYSSWQPISNLIVGSLLGNAKAGAYDLALKLTKAVRGPAKILEKNYYPEVVRLDPRTKEPWFFVFRFFWISVLAGFIGMLFVYFGGSPLLTLLGHRYSRAAADLSQWIAPSILFSLISLPLDSILFTSGRASSLLVIEAVSVLFYMIMIMMFEPLMGLNGIGLAYSMGRGMIAALSIILSFYVFFRRKYIIPPHEGKI